MARCSNSRAWGWLCQYMAKYSNCMAYVELITLTLFHISVSPGTTAYVLPFGHDPARQRRYVIRGFPILRWASGAFWDEANIWLGQLAQSIPVKDITIKTIRAIAYALLTFMRFVETEGRAWNYLPMIPADRTINRYRKHLIDARDAGVLAPSTAKAKMSIALRLFRWAQANKVISLVSFEVTSSKVLKVPDRYGRELAISIQFSNLSIPNRKKAVDRVEGGLLPVSQDYKNQLLKFASIALSSELDLMLRIAFESGLRIESICDLKINTIYWAAPDMYAPGLYWLQVGPNVEGAPVSTKYGVNGSVMIGSDLLQELRDYGKSTRRLLNEQHASVDNRSLLFITRRGNPYGRHVDADRSAINSMVYDMKARARSAGLNFDDFHFHRARATFGISIVQCGMDCQPNIAMSDVLAFARDCLLHQHVDTTMTYVKFLERTKIKTRYANEYTSAIMGLHSEREK